VKRFLNNTHISKITLIILFIFISYSSYESYNLENKKRELKSDLIELSDIKYGMFNADEWKKQISNIITQKLNELELNIDNKKIAEEKITKLLYTLIDEFEIDYKQKNEKNSIFGISFRNIGAEYFSIFLNLKEQVPNITEQIFTFLDKKENTERIKDYIFLQLDKYSENTFQKIDYSKLNKILIKYDSIDKNICKQKIRNNITEINSKNNHYSTVIFFTYNIILLMIFFGKNHSTLKITLYASTAFLLLILGVFLPMIDIDARISIMEFNLMGETIAFENQILYYKSKSIIEMSKLMLLQKKAEVFIVGLLIFIFSILIPVFKLFSFAILIFKNQVKKNKILFFLAFKSGKWSMADVMVVAIFMSYIGFSGIISNQLNQLENISENITILTTNYSELQNGFYFFLGFVLISISISQKIMIPKKEIQNVKEA